MQESAALRVLWKYKIKKPTPKWITFSNRFDIAEQFDTFHKDNIFGEEPDCLHELLKAGKKYKKFRNRPLSLEEWRDVFREVMVDEQSEKYIGYDLDDEKESETRDKVVELGIKLTKTNPILSFDESAWKSNNTFQENDGNKAWVAAYTLFGAAWFTGTESWANQWEEKERRDNLEKNRNKTDDGEEMEPEEEVTKPQRLRGI